VRGEKRGKGNVFPVASLEGKWWGLPDEHPPPGVLYCAANVPGNTFPQ